MKRYFVEINGKNKFDPSYQMDLSFSKPEKDGLAHYAKIDYMDVSTNVLKTVLFDKRESGIHFSYLGILTNPSEVLEKQLKDNLNYCFVSANPHEEWKGFFVKGTDIFYWDTLNDKFVKCGKIIDRKAKK